MNMNLDREAGTITQGDIAIGKAVARLAGGFQTPGEAQVMNLRLAPDMPVDFRMMADLQSERADARAQRTGRGGDRGGVAFMIQGTTSSPKFVPDVGSIAGNAARGAIQKTVSGKTGGKTGLGGILGKRKPN